MKKIPLIAVFVFLAACDVVAPPVARPTLPTPAQDTCNATQYAALIGQDATALERILLLGEVRVIRPGQAVTLDFRPERINFNIGPDNRIATINCS